MTFGFVTTGSYPTRSGNAVEILIDGDPAFKRICQAIDRAQHRVWATITFMWPEFRMPDERGSALEVLKRAAQRGVDVRLIFWRPDDETASLRRNAFWGSAEHFELLEQLQPDIGIRWDRAHPSFCQHQKTWLIDADAEGQIAFLGSLNLNPNSVVTFGHRGQQQNHDVMIELTGPAVADIHHNFVQRWNEASERHSTDGIWGARGATELEFPTRLPAECGPVTVQIQRTIHAGRYQNNHAAVGGQPFDVAVGERTIVAQYCSAIRSARRSIYMENQYVEIPEIVEAVHGALQRGVEVVLVMPITPDVSTSAYESPERRAFFEARAALGQYESFTLVGLAGLGLDGQRKPVWIHSKIMLIDDTWATVGSANLHRFSMFGNGELNATILSSDTVRAFRIAVLEEHLALNTSELDDVSALRLFKQLAHANHERFLRQDHAWDGLGVALEVSTYGQKPPMGW
jgi:cardiolipin synthase A/B